MKITRISQQQVRKERFSVYVDGEYRLSLSQDQLADAGLRSGDELTPAQFTQLAHLSELGKALEGAYRFLSYRSRSRQEVEQHLRRKQYDASLIDEVIAQLEAVGVLNDLLFAREWIANRQLLNPRSPLELKVELRQKGISPGLIDEAVASMTWDNEVVMIESLIAQKKLRRRYPEERKLLSYLASKGYSFQAIRTVLEANNEDKTI
ncbi:MAG TPA: RecX family transcriptional regulator [Candidatus Saccharimonadia bacterium]